MSKSRTSMQSFTMRRTICHEILMNSKKNCNCMVLHVGTNEPKDKESELITAEFTEIVNLVRKERQNEYQHRYDYTHHTTKARLVNALIRQNPDVTYLKGPADLVHYNRSKQILIRVLYFTYALPVPSGISRPSSCCL